MALAGMRKARVPKDAPKAPNLGEFIRETIWSACGLRAAHVAHGMHVS